MIINIDKLSEEGLTVSKEFEFFSVDLIDENAVFLDPLRADIEVRRVNEEIMVTGRIKTRLSFVCSRCLSPYTVPVDSEFDLILYPEEMDILKDQLELEDMNQYFYYSRSLDLQEIVLEQLNMTFPVKPLCHQKCQGICPVCGKVVKEGQCSCSRSDSDPRLDKLKKFIRDKG